MNIGLAFDLKQSICLTKQHPDDALEEYDSPETVQGIVRVLESLGHSVVLLGGGRDFIRNIESRYIGIDFVFNIAEGRGNYRSREAQVPAVLEMLDIPYSGSDPECLALCLDKPLTKKIVALDGVPTPEWRLVASKDGLPEMRWDKFPAFIKPAYEGSSKGIRTGSRVENKSQLMETVTALLNGYEQAIMVEEFIPGHEVTVGMMGNDPPRVIGIMRVLPKKPQPNFVYSLEVKRDWENLVDYECPARLDSEVLKKIANYSLSAFRTLGCRDFARLDFRVTEEGVPYFLEINPLAGLNPHSSDLPIMARKVGGSYEALIAAILEAAFGRYPQCAQR